MPADWKGSTPRAYSWRIWVVAAVYDEGSLANATRSASCPWLIRRGSGISDFPCQVFCDILLREVLCGSMEKGAHEL